MGVIGKGRTNHQLFAVVMDRRMRFIKPLWIVTFADDIVIYMSMWRFDLESRGIERPKLISHLCGAP